MNIAPSAKTEKGGESSMFEFEHAKNILWDLKMEGKIRNQKDQEKNLPSIFLF